jgi:hypothetical protein
LISGEAVFIDNDNYYGILLAYSEIKIVGNLNFTDNHVSNFGCIYVIGLRVMINGTMLMNSNTGETGSAINAYNSSISILCTVHIVIF